MSAAIASLVPTRRTRALVCRMVATAEQSSGAEAAALLLDEVEPDQLYALVGALLAAVRPQSEGHRGRLPDVLAEDEMRRGYSLYRQGIRTPFTRAARRQYERQRKRDERARTAPTKGHG